MVILKHFLVALHNESSYQFNTHKPKKKCLRDKTQLEN